MTLQVDNLENGLHELPQYASHLCSAVSGSFGPLNSDDGKDHQYGGVDVFYGNLDVHSEYQLLRENKCDLIIFEACAAAKLLRNRLLRERTRVVERIEALRERQIYNETTDEDFDYDNDDAEAQLAGGDVSRTEFIFMCEMMVAEKLVVPLLLAHGMSFSDTLLPQLLKLLAVMLLPIPRFSANEVLQKDMLQKIKTRCGTDEFFALLVQCVAPIAEKRTTGELHREDVIILEIVLTVITYLLDGHPTNTERIIGAFCRNHGVELLLVVINQNYSRIHGINAAANSDSSNEAVNNLDGRKNEGHEKDTSGVSLKLDQVRDEIHLEEEGSDVGLEDDDSVPASRSSDMMHRALDQEFEKQVSNLLESDEQLWKWNCLVLAAMASIIWCVPAEELAHLTMLGHTSDSSPDRVLSTLLNGQHFRDCKKASDKWRFVARSRNGAVTSNGILVRASSGSVTGGRAIGTVFSLLGPRRKDPLEAMKDVDLRKRGRFVKGMYQDLTPQCNIPLPTKIQLSHQNSAFLSFGFEPLSVMTFRKLQDAAAAVESATKEHKEVVVGYKGSGETVEVTSPLDTAMYQNLGNVLHYMTICRCILRYVRLITEQLKTEKQSFLVVFPQQWQSVSAIISLDYVELGFSVLRSFLDCKDIRRREDISIAVGYLAEILLLLNSLLQGEIAADPAVQVAAHALASSVLYKEENIKAVFGLLSEYSRRVIAIRKAQVFTLFTFSVFQLMEKCSYKGNLLLPKRSKQQKKTAPADEAEDMGGAENQDDNESVDSAALEDLSEEMLRGMADMIDDEKGDDNTWQPDFEASVQSSVALEQKVPSAAADLPEPAFEPVGGSASVDGDGLGPSKRATSQGRPSSIASSDRTALSTMSSEREVAVSGFFHRLASPKNISLVYSTLRHWRVNDADVNIALTFLMDTLVRHNCESVFFNVAFLLLMREVLVNGEKTHAPLYAVCDRIVYDFFNPSFAKAQDARAASVLQLEVENGMLSGAQSYLGFEVSLRCTRALFNLSTLDYTYIEEKGMPHLMSYTAIPLSHENISDAKREEFTAVADETISTRSPDSRSRRQRRTATSAGDTSQRDGSKLASEVEDGDERAVLSPSPAAEGCDNKLERGWKRRHHHGHGEKKRRRHDVYDAVAADEDDASGRDSESATDMTKTEDVAAATAAQPGAVAAPLFGAAKGMSMAEDAQ
ncbi:hypothetical protein CGC20_36960 [Leishmania donovani]|uniref:Timeless N-terminal domain-containing protein n=1 Tax=Leishmania donovani TaxID=5661 RepID=A0A504WWK9_LEIDO|nr:hypothetical protein CGC20_36960 [Leishmania donovani]